MELKIKLVIIGDPAVGKTSLVKKYISHYFSNDYKASIGTNIFIKEVDLEYKNQKIKIKIQLWDIAGQERWTKMRHIYYKGADGALLVIDLTRFRTLKQIEDFWYPDLKKNCGNIPIILIANKNDLMGKITDEDINKLGSILNANYIINTSAKMGVNVEKAFNLISKSAIKKFIKESEN